jgi:hypothetical protein
MIDNTPRPTADADRVSAWLEPMFAAAEDRPGIDLWDLIRAAAVPVFARAPDPGDFPDLTAVVDWVRFGRLLREALGWDSYPAAPPNDDCAASP